MYSEQKAFFFFFPLSRTPWSTTTEGIRSAAKEEVGCHQVIAPLGHRHFLPFVSSRSLLLYEELKAKKTRMQDLSKHWKTIWWLITFAKTAIRVMALYFLWQTWCPGEGYPVPLRSTALLVGLSVPFLAWSIKYFGQKGMILMAGCWVARW